MKIWNRALALASVLLLFLVPGAQAQSTDGSPEGAAPTSAFFEAVDVNLVNVEVFVTDRKGNAITDLRREDFQLLVDGQEVPVSNFYAQAAGRPVERVQAVDAVHPGEDDPSSIPPDQRLHLILFVDNLHLTPGNRKRTFKHLREFLDNNLRSEDLVTVISQNRSLFIHNDFLNDRRVLDDILDEVADMASPSHVGRATQRRLFQELGILRNDHIGQDVLDREKDSLLSQIRAHAHSEHSLASASIDSLERLLATLGGIRGRKALIHVSDGINTKPGEALYETWLGIFGDANNSYELDVGSFDLLPRFRKLGRAANTSGVTFYSIDAETDHASIGRSAAMAGGAGGILPIQVIELLGNNPRETMELTAQTTGGRRVQRTQKLTETLGQLAQDFQTFYSLGFQAESSDPEKPHRIEVKVRRKGLRARHRETFQTRGRDHRSGDFAMAALLYNSVDNPLGITLEPGEIQRQDDGSALLTVLVKIPVGKLVLLPQGPNHSAQLSFFVSVKDKGGDPRPVQKIPFHLPIPADKVDEAKGREAAYPLPLVVRPGDLQAVVGVRDDYASQDSVVRMDLDRFSGTSRSGKTR